MISTLSLLLLSCTPLVIASLLPYKYHNLPRIQPNLNDDNNNNDSILSSAINTLSSPPLSRPANTPTTSAPFVPDISRPAYIPTLTTGFPRPSVVGPGLESTGIDTIFLTQSSTSGSSASLGVPGTGTQSLTSLAGTVVPFTTSSAATVVSRAGSSVGSSDSGNTATTTTTTASQSQSSSTTATALTGSGTNGAVAVGQGMGMWSYRVAGVVAGVGLLAI